MEGYSVTEAASILGVPTERVWELLARGVLSGAPEGDTGMRVYLQPRPAPAPPVAEAGRPNGGSHQTEQRELSPFRELLTEFRNLTERYGQALLALGEARGEVAALRSRVDLLEARMDLRLPVAPAGLADHGWGSGQMERAATPAPAPAPPHARPDREPPPVSHTEEAEAPEDEHDRPSGRRRSGQRRATEAFAEALARADDPTRPELPGAAETAAAMAALRDHAVAEAQETQAEAILPRELPAADSIPSADEVSAAPRPAAHAEPQPEPDPEPEPPPEAEAEPEPGPQPEEEMPRETEAPERVAAEASVGPEEPAEPQPSVVEVPPPVESAVEPVSEPVSLSGPDAADVEPGTEAQVDGVAAGGAPVTVTEPAPAAPEEAAVAPPIDWDPDRYTVAIEEPDWFAGEVASDGDERRQEPIAPPATDVEHEDPAPNVEAEAEPQPIDQPDTEPEADDKTEATPEPVQEPAEDDLADAVQPTPEPAAGGGATVSAAEETMLWFGRGAQERAAAASTDEGADEMEVSGGGRGEGGRQMPGARELDDALAALDSLARGSQPPAPSEAEPMPPPEPQPEPETVVAPVASPPAPAWPVTDAPSASADDPWIPPEPTPVPAPDRASATPASRAYRRLRRIFPG